MGDFNSFPCLFRFTKGAMALSCSPFLFWVEMSKAWSNAEEMEKGGTHVSKSQKESKSFPTR